MWTDTDTAFLATQTITGLSLFSIQNTTCADSCGVTIKENNPGDILTDTQKH
jgi:hypothetical protein